MKRPALSIVIPAYQEATRIEKSLEQLAAYLKAHKLAAEVIVSVPTSPDGTAKLAESKAGLFQDFRVVAAGPKAGKGRDVRVGIMEARGELKLFMDADLATPLHYIKNVLELHRQGSEVIIAVRDLNSSHTGIRKLLSSSGNWLVQAALLRGIKDTQCGFKAFSAKAADELFRRQTILGWGFDMEILAIAKMRKYPIAQIEVPDWTDKPDGTFEGSVSSAAVETLGELALILWRKWTGRYRSPNFTYEPYQS